MLIDFEDVRLQAPIGHGIRNATPGSFRRRSALLGVARAPSDHEFGSAATDFKLSLVEAYLKQFTTALRSRYPSLWYIDAFAGTGVRTVKHKAQEQNLFGPAVDERTEDRRGSALIAINTKPPFSRLFFSDIRLQHSKALKALADEHPNREIAVTRGNANTFVLDVIGLGKWSRTRAVLFLDPYGLQVDWTTLQAVRRTEAIDVWYLVSLSGLYRQAALDRGKITPIKRARLNAMLGTNGWETDWYPPSSIQIFDDTPDDQRRVASVDDISSWVLARLRGLFPAVLDPIRLHDKNGRPAFALFFAMSNPDPKAIELATRIAGHILKSGMVSQVRPLK
jgi:three-Cys-motif partner protein